MSEVCRRWFVGGKESEKERERRSEILRAGGGRVRRTEERKGGRGQWGETRKEGEAREMKDRVKGGKERKEGGRERSAPRDGPVEREAQAMAVQPWQKHMRRQFRTWQRGCSTTASSGRQDPTWQSGCERRRGADVERSDDAPRSTSFQTTATHGRSISDLCVAQTLVGLRGCDPASVMGECHEGNMHATDPLTTDVPDNKLFSYPQLSKAVSSCQKFAVVMCSLPQLQRRMADGDTEERMEETRRRWGGRKNGDGLF